MYDIKNLVECENKFKRHCKFHFINFFRGFDYSNLNKDVKCYDILSYADIEKLRYSCGFYLILTDYMAEENQCKLEVNGLKVIYRGHGVRIRKRVESHLYNNDYNKNKDGTNYTACLKLNGDNGISLKNKPYSDYKWAVIQHSMTDSSKTMREQAEQAFDKCFYQPIGSND